MNNEIDNIKIINFSNKEIKLHITYSTEQIESVNIMKDSLTNINVMSTSDDKSLIAFNIDNQLKFWSITQGKEILDKTPLTQYYRDIEYGLYYELLAISFSIDNKNILILSEAINSKQVVSLWATGAGQLLQTFTIYDKYITDVQFSDDGDYVLLKHDDRVETYKINPNESHKTLFFDSNINNAILNSDEKLLYAVSESAEKIYVHSIESGKLLNNCNISFPR